MQSGSVARLGGDEFALLFPCDDEGQAMTVCQQAVRRISEQFVFGRRRLNLSAAAGVCFAGGESSDLLQLLRRADIALFRAKRTGRGKVKLFSTEMDVNLQRETNIEQALREPGVHHSIDLAYQPIVDLRTQELQSFEALARWRHSELGWIGPGEFIPITERISVIEQISDALLARAAAQANRWPSSVNLSFNLSAAELCSSNTSAKIIRIITEAGLDPRRLHIEVTETAFLADFETARRNMADLRAHGVQIVLDDFGAGFASISYLREMAFDAVKLDGSLVISAGMGVGLPLLTGVLRLCEAVGLPCIAEHVETANHLRMLQSLHCCYGQGYGLARPMGADAAERFARTAPKRIEDLFRLAAA
ncbi:bifunctional diguanylate cyclase/phosphodiesterase [Novosphingobium sp. Gsoil 351]|uniref:putative bifunctional diguanylate cyclase/phosphodiesterase n=1 Tax=Novosphingobium sp. Gsoil 351 TaxID=2675225 RepID=UPI00272E06AE|nr:EAL domain-containing protein [Novosphingobium sp. Gsoil 351]